MAEFAVSVASNLAYKLEELLFAPVGRSCGYVISHDSYIRQLTNEVEKLDCVRLEVQHFVDQALNNRECIRPEVEEWMKQVAVVANEAHTLLGEKSARLPNPKLRYRLSREARIIAKDIQALIEQGRFKKVYFERAPPGLVASAPKGNFSATDQGDTIIKFRASILAEIMHALDDEKVKVIGVYEPLGVGKTMLLEEVEKKLRNESRLFDVIATANVSQTPDLNKIQDDIACAFSLNLNDVQSEPRRRDLLLRRLQRDPSEKVLIILDNLWNELDLRSVGIPSGDESKGCKLLLISRYNNVLQQMCADQTFHLEDDKAFRQFEKTVGDRLQDDEKLKAKAPQVVEEFPGTFDKSCQFEPPHQAEELERSSIEIESGPPEYSRKVLMRGGLGLTEPPEVTRWQSFTEIYLMENELAELPENPRCPGLLVLFLNRNCKLRTISPPFFDFMPALEILNLSRTRIKSLPESLFRLSRLKRLFLNHCELLRVLPPKVGELQQLEVLDLEGTEIIDLPKEVAKLTKLTCLEVSFCPRTNCGTKSAEANALIPPGTISALSQLEELSIDTHPEDEGWESIVEAIVDDVCGLMRLDTLKLYFPQVENLRKWFGTSKVSRSLLHFKFIVGKHAERIMCYLPKDLEFEFEYWDRSLKYVNGVGVPIDIQKMLQHTFAFLLDRHRDVAKLSDFGIENMEQLKCCIIGECKEIKVIVDGTDTYDEADRSEIVSETQEDGRRFLGSLEYLYIYRMKSLSCIYEGPLHRGSFSRLKCLAFLTCPQLTSIFTPGLLENLDSLEELNVQDCPLVLSLVSCKDTSIYESTCFLPKLKKISLVSLPGLISISSGLRIAPNLERWSIIDCPNLESTSADEICRGRLTGPRGKGGNRRRPLFC